MMELLCLKLYRLRLLLQVNVLPEFEDFGYTCNFKSVIFPCYALFE